MATKIITIHVLDLAQNQEVEVEREAEAESAIIQTCITGEKGNQHRRASWIDVERNVKRSVLLGP